MPGNPKLIRLTTVFAVVCATALVAACRESEQNRPLAFEKGVYGGQADQTISEETRGELKDRVRLQSFN